MRKYSNVFELQCDGSASHTTPSRLTKIPRDRLHGHFHWHNTQSCTQLQAESDTCWLRRPVRYTLWSRSIHSTARRINTTLEDYLSKSNFKDHYGDVHVVMKQCLGKIAEINEFSASDEMLWVMRQTGRQQVDCFKVEDRHSTKCQ